jgi:hypothetical protein
MARYGNCNISLRISDFCFTIGRVWTALIIHWSTPNYTRATPFLILLSDRSLPSVAMMVDIPGPNFQPGDHHQRTAAKRPSTEKGDNSRFFQ